MYLGVRMGVPYSLYKYCVFGCPFVTKTRYTEFMKCGGTPDVITMYEVKCHKKWCHEKTPHFQFSNFVFITNIIHRGFKR